MSGRTTDIEELVNRHGKQLKTLVYPFLVLYTIGHLKKASSVEIIDYIENLAGRKVAYQKNSYYRLIGSMEHEFEIIEPVDFIKEKGPARIYYGLTPKGKKLLDKLLKEIYLPLQEMLPKEKES